MPHEDVRRGFSQNKFALDFYLYVLNKVFECKYIELVCTNLFNILVSLSVIYVPELHVVIFVSVKINNVLYYVKGNSSILNYTYKN